VVVITIETKGLSVGDASDTVAVESVINWSMVVLTLAQDCPGERRTTCERNEFHFSVIIIYLQTSDDLMVDRWGFKLVVALRFRMTLLTFVNEFWLSSAWVESDG